MFSFDVADDVAVAEPTEGPAAEVLVNGRGEDLEKQECVSANESDALPVEKQEAAPASPAQPAHERVSREEAEAFHAERIADATEDHKLHALKRSELETELKEVKAEEKAALAKLKSLTERGPDYNALKSRPKPRFNEDHAGEPEDDTPQPWLEIPTMDVIEEIPGMGSKKAESIRELAPTLGDLEELRAEAGKAHKHFSEVLPKGVGKSLAEEIENRIGDVVCKFAAQQAKDSAKPLEGDPERTAKVRKDFVMPTPPSPDLNACAMHDGDTWSFLWLSNDGDERLMDPQPWPFVEDSANESDMSAAGFEVL